MMPYQFPNVTFVLLFLLSTLSSYGQEEVALFDYEEGIASRNRGEYDMAITYLNSFIKRYPKAKPDAYYHRGYVYLYQKKFDHAIDDFSAYQKLQPSNAEAAYMLGRTYQLINEYDKAILHFDQTIEIDPRFARAYNDRGWMYCLQKDFDRALNNFQQATTIDTSFAMAYNNAGAARYFNQDIAKPNNRDINIAIEWFSKAIVQDPNLGLAYRNRAAMYIFQKKYKAAVKDLTKASTLNPEDAMIPFYSGVIAADLGQKKQAMDLFGNASAIDPSMPFTHEEVGNLFKSEGAPNDAIAAYYRAKALKKGSIYAGLMDYKIAQVHAQTGNEKVMYSFLKKACKQQVFKDRSVAHDLQHAEEFAPYRKDKKFKKLMAKVNRGEKNNKFLGPDLGWFRIRK